MVVSKMEIVTFGGGRRMNKEEMIEYIKGKQVWFGNHNFILIKKKELISMFEQLHEPQKVKIPKFVANYIEIEKKEANWKINWI